MEPLKSKYINPQDLKEGLERCVLCSKEPGEECSECPLFEPGDRCVNWCKCIRVDEHKLPEGSWVSFIIKHKDEILRNAIEQYSDPLYADLLKVKELSDEQP